MKPSLLFKALSLVVICGCVSNPVVAPSSSAGVAKAEDSPPCMTNFESSGSFVAGKQYKTYETFPRRTQAVAFDSLVQAVSSGGYQIISADKGSGVISAAQAVSYSRGAQSAPLNVSVRKSQSGGVRVEIVFSLAGGLLASTDTIQKEFCRMLSAVRDGFDEVPAEKAKASTTKTISIPGVLPITSAQQSAIQSALARRTGKANVDKLIREASPTISSILGIHGCWVYTSGTNNPLGIYEAPGSHIWGGVLTNRPTKLQYHAKDACVSVNRVQGWTMPAANALKFEAIFRSDSSQETQKVTYEVVRQPSGDWLLSGVY